MRRSSTWPVKKSQTTFARIAHLETIASGAKQELQSAATKSAFFLAVDVQTHHAIALGHDCHVVPGVGLDNRGSADNPIRVTGTDVMLKSGLGANLLFSAVVLGHDPNLIRYIDLLGRWRSVRKKTLIGIRLLLLS